MKHVLEVIIKKFKLDKKLKKLKNNPKLFLQDFIQKKLNFLLRYIPVSTKGQNTFTIVTAVYNAEKYLDDFFSSIAGQSLNFKHNLQIICVDDGSIDHSAKIIEKWKTKYPDNIHYFYKENGGQSSARNLGLNHVKTKWVTFTDPDDFLDRDYFKELDKNISVNKELKLIATNIILYMEAEKLIKNTHPLKDRFNKNYTFHIRKWENHINLSAASSVFDMELIRSRQLTFDERIKPNFEDGKFIADYTLEQESGHILFLKDAIYYYRKRSNKTSTIDTSWMHEGKFDHVLRYGHLAMLKSYADQLNSVPAFIQRTALYDAAWYLKYLLNNDAKTAHLTDFQKETFLALLKEIFTYIDVSTIHAFNLVGIWFKHKVGILGFFKNEKVENQITYVENFDKEKKQIKVSFFSHYIPNITCILNGIEVLPSYVKQVKNTFVGESFVSEYVVWIPYIQDTDQLEIKLDGHISRLSLKGKHYKNLRIKTILNSFQDYKKYSNDGSWILLDRDTQADDNAEHLYRYIKTNNLKEDCYFALRKESSDWKRLKEEGFNLLDFGSNEFEEKLRTCNKVISSHLDKYVNNYFGDEYGYTKKFVFLQHGITKDDMSNWFNTKKNLQCLVTATRDEYESIAHGSTYNLSPKEVLLSGFPRHDQLLKNHTSEKIILIMPTWRNSLVGATVGAGNTRQENDQFMNTDFAQRWNAILTAPELKQYVEKEGYQILFAPHANIVPYLKYFNLPSYVQVWTKEKSNFSIQDLFKKAQFMLTDYSSVAFEIAYLGKQVIYYQFDADEVFSGNHIYKKGYFEYEKHGFGPVVHEHNDVMHALEKLIQNDGLIFDEYLQRIENTFTVRDQNNCKRVYEHLLSMDQYSVDVLELPSLVQLIENAIKNYDLASLKVRLNYLFEHYPEAEITEKYTDTFNYLNGLDDEPEVEPKFKHKSSLAVLCDALFDQDFKYYQKHISELIVEDKHADIMYLLKLLCYENAENFLTQFEENIADNGFRLRAEQCNLDLLYLQALLKLDHYECYEQYKNAQKLTYRNLDFKLKLQSLDFEKAFLLKDWALLISIYEKFVGQSQYLSKEENLEKYIVALLNSNQEKNLETFIEQASMCFPNSDVLTSLKLKVFSNNNDYYSVMSLFENSSIVLDDNNKYAILKSYYRCGEFSKARKILIKPVFTDDFSYWMLVWEIALQEGDMALDTYCRRHIWAYFPEQFQKNLPRINIMLEMLTSSHKRVLAS